MKDTLRKYAEQNKEGKEWPAWYFHHDVERAESNFKYPDEQPHPSTKDHSPNWDRSIKPAGPIGLLIESALWHGMAIDGNFKLRQKGEQPVDIFNLPYQDLKPLTLRAAALARTRAEWGRDTSNAMAK